MARACQSVKGHFSLFCLVMIYWIHLGNLMSCSVWWCLASVTKERRPKGRDAKGPNVKGDLLDLLPSISGSLIVYDHFHRDLRGFLGCCLVARFMVHQLRVLRSIPALLVFAICCLRFICIVGAASVVVDLGCLVVGTFLIQDGDGHQPSKPAPPPKPSSLIGTHADGRGSSLSGRDLQITPEMFNQLRVLKRKTKDLRVEVRNLRRIARVQAMNIKETIGETFTKIKTMLAAVESDDDQSSAERHRVSHEEMYRQNIAQLQKSLSELESTVEELRSNVINRCCPVNLTEVENMALVLSKASKMVADLKARYPSLQESLKSVMGVEMEVIVKEEKFLKDEPERLENALRRCKKLTGTLVTLKRLASVQEQRLPPTSPGLEQRAASLPSSASVVEQQLDGICIGPDGQISKAASFSGDMSRQSSVSGESTRGSVKGDASLDALLDELQTAARPSERSRSTEVYASTGALKRPPPPLPTSSSYTGGGGSSATDSPVRGQVVSQGPTGSLTVSVTAPAISKLQVSDAGSRQSTSPSPTPPSAQQQQVVLLTTTTIEGGSGKVSPQPPEVFSRSGVRHTVIEGPPDEGSPPPPPPPDKSSSLAAPGLLGKKVPPPPPPRTSSKSPLVSPTSPMSPSARMTAAAYAGPCPPRANSLQVSNYANTSGMMISPRLHHSSLDSANGLPVVTARKLPPCQQNGGSGPGPHHHPHQRVPNNGDASPAPPDGGKDGGQEGVLRTVAISDENLRRDQLSSNSSSSESVNSQEGLQGKSRSFEGPDPTLPPEQSSKKTPPTPPTRNRQEILEQRHQELLRRQKQLQEQYARLQQLQRGQTLQRFSPPRSPADLKKTGSESNILSKAGLALSTTSGSLTHLAALPAGAALGKNVVANSLMTTSAPSSTSGGGPSVSVTGGTSPATLGGGGGGGTTTTTTNKIYETDIL